MNLPIEKTVTENACGLNLPDYHLFHNNICIFAYECTHRNAYIHKQIYMFGDQQANRNPDKDIKAHKTFRKCKRNATI